MHSTILEKFTFLHDGDYGGQIFIVNRLTGQEMHVDSSELFDFLGQFLRSQKIRQIESLSGRGFIDELVGSCP